MTNVPINFKEQRVFKGDKPTRRFRFLWKFPVLEEGEIVMVRRRQTQTFATDSEAKQYATMLRKHIQQEANKYYRWNKPTEF